MVKQLSGKKLTKALDSAIRDLFKKKYGDNPTCFVCGRKDGWFSPKTRPYGIQVGHYVARGRTILRWDLDNVYPQCSKCNVIHNSNPAPFTLAILKKYGTARITHLNKTAKEAVGKKIPISAKRELLKELTLDKQSV